jgi:hypothetical protein
MKTQLILGAAALALAACGSSDKSDGNGSAAASGGGGVVAAGVTLQPGEWEMKTEVVSIAAPGMPAGMTEGMKANAGSTSRTCMTPEEAKGPKGDMFAGDNAANCKSENFSWSGGKIKGKTTCTPPGGGKTVMTMDGSYTPQSMEMSMKSETDIAGRAMTMEMRMSGRRVGECSAATKEG